MHAKLFGRALGALALFLTLAAPAAASDDCICTHRANIVVSGDRHNWFATANGPQLTVTVVMPVTQAGPESAVARIFNGANTLVGQITTVDAAPRQSATVASTPGEAFRVEVSSPNQFVRYWLRFDGAADVSTDGGFNNNESGRQTWLVKVDAADPAGIRLFTLGVPPFDAGGGPVDYQWVAPNGDAESVNTFTIPPGPVDTTIPPPAALSTGTWRLRLQSLRVTGGGFDYRIEKTTGADRRLYNDRESSGRGGARLTFVDQNGDPFVDEVPVTLNFGEPVTFGVSGGVFETLDGDAFHHPLLIGAPSPGLVATPSSFDFRVLCDQLTEYTVVLAPPQPPSITVTPSTTTLWPPNNKMVAIAVNVAASSSQGNPVSIELLSIVSSEPGGASDIAGAAFGTDDRTFELRAKRTGGGAGRVYTVTYRATDTVTGLSATATLTIAVPHDQGSSDQGSGIRVQGSGFREPHP